VRRLYNLSGPGLLIYGLTVTLASVDWVMSLEPSWFSTIYSAVFMVGQVLSSLAFMITALMLLVDRTSLSEIVSEKYLNDLGNMLLTFVILWAYVAFSQFLIVWSGNLSDEISWYFNRTRNGWGWIAALLIVFHFFLPFLLLLSRTVKRRVAMLGALAAALLVIRLLDMFWTVEPAFDRTAVRFHWLDWAAVIGIGGIWLAAFVRQLKNRPLLPLHDPRLREMLEEAGASE
jgi:amino acid permease